MLASVIRLIVLEGRAFLAISPVLLIFTLSWIVYLAGVAVATIARFIRGKNSII